ncbi:hypothetical protein E2C01_061271 [Portunus trituberculatus]|uniref:Uncharacterized protein n=1 Tax=Portunus trituberculatus TaxID=210409 RepID=A0A5B7HAU8_PORTR|nr:hypothetical protein [Portunus trituberculatus]
MEVVCTSTDNNLLPGSAPELPPIGQLRNSLARSLKLRLVLSLKMRWLGQIAYKQTDRAN